MIIINNTDNKLMKQFVEKVLRKVPNKSKYNLDVEISILDYDLDRVYLECCSNECTIRMWDVHNLPNGRGSQIRWSFYFYTEGIDTPEELAQGCTNVFIEEIKEEC